MHEITPNAIDRHKTPATLISEFEIGDAEGITF
jgi:hypothetical protein